MSDEYFQFEDQPVEIKTEPSAALKRAQSLVGTSTGRPDDDFYPTPPEATMALLAREKFIGNIWEPACGDGAICEVLLKQGHAVIATDLNYRGYGLQEPVDFLTAPEHHTATNIITNPPFKYAEEFIHMSLARTTGKVAMLCKLQFLEGAKRRKMFESTPLKTVYVFSKRLSMTRNGEKMKNSGMIAFAWFVWDHAHEGDATIAWI
jgi:hypothetical protein